MRDSEERTGGATKGLNWRFGGSSRRKLTQVWNVTPTKIGSRAMQRKHSLRLVTSRDSRIKFGATRRGYIFGQGGPGGCLGKYTPNILTSRSKRHIVPNDVCVCATSDSTRSKGYGFRTRATHSCKRVRIKCVKTSPDANSFGEKDEDPPSIDREKNIAEGSKRFQITNRFCAFLICFE